MVNRIIGAIVNHCDLLKKDLAFFKPPFKVFACVLPYCYEVQSRHHCFEESHAGHKNLVKILIELLQVEGLEYCPVDAGVGLLCVRDSIVQHALQVFHHVREMHQFPQVLLQDIQVLKLWLPTILFTTSLWSVIEDDFELQSLQTHDVLHHHVYNVTLSGQVTIFDLVVIKPKLVFLLHMEIFLAALFCVQFVIFEDSDGVFETEFFLVAYRALFVIGLEEVFLVEDLFGFLDFFNHAEISSSF